MLLYCFFKEICLVILLDQNREKEMLTLDIHEIELQDIVITESKTIRTILLNISTLISISLSFHLDDIASIFNTFLYLLLLNDTSFNSVTSQILYLLVWLYKGMT